MINKIKSLAISLLGVFSIWVILPASVSAIDCTLPANQNTTACQIQGGVNSAAGSSDTSKADSNLSKTIQTVINVLSIVIGVIAVIVVIIAGLTYITSGGNEQKTATAKNTIIYAVVGLIIVALSQVIVRFTINSATCDPKGSDTSCSGYCTYHPNDAACTSSSSGSGSNPTNPTSPAKIPQ